MRDWVQLARRIVGSRRLLLRRTRPLSEVWGFERGSPIDRVYIEGFLAEHADDITGRVLEVRDNGYTERFGRGITASDILDVDPANARATIVTDLADANAVPADTFDCFVLTQTLQYVRDLPAAVGHVHRILRPGGVLLASAPSIIRVDPAARDHDRWRFTETSCRELFGEAFGPERVEVSTGGNFPAALAFLAGMAAEELDSARLRIRDPDFPLVILVRAVKDRAPG